MKLELKFFPRLFIISIKLLLNIPLLLTIDLRTPKNVYLPKNYCRQLYYFKIPAIDNRNNYGRPFYIFKAILKSAVPIFRQILNTRLFAYKYINNILYNVHC